MTKWQANPWRDLSTASLLRERECRQWDLADIDANPDGWSFAPESRAFVEYLLIELANELSRRKRLSTNTHAPDLPAIPKDRRDELEEIKRRVTVIDLIHSEVWREYERRGAHDVWCNCPIPGHEETTPSFHIDERQQVWHCFGCGQGGDVFELARHLWSESLFFRVVDRLKEIAGIQPAIVVKAVAEVQTVPNAIRPDGLVHPVRIASPKRRQFNYGR